MTVYYFHSFIGLLSGVGAVGIRKMEVASCLWAWQMLFTVILLADLWSFLSINTVSGMRLPHDDIKFPKSHLIASQQLESTFIHGHTAKKVENVRPHPLEGSSRREVEALIAFKDSVTSDPLRALKSWNANDSDACSWMGVKCSALSSNVADLDLRNLGLVGIVPQSIGFLNYLEYFDVSNNTLSGSIPYSIANCSKLWYLNVSYNQVSGDFPFEIGKLSHLMTLDAAQNNFTGLIPEVLGNCSKLEILNLGYNNLEGAIPLTVGKLSRLKLLALPYNILSGTIPRTLGNCSSLVTLRLNNNYNFGGVLPEELSLLIEIELISVHECNFVGALPAWVFKFTSLAGLDLVGNSFSGQIPEEIGKHSESLTYLVLSLNQLTGLIPPAIVNCSKLVWLELHGNQMTGNIPYDIGFLSNLEALSFEWNSFTGVIPPSISNCSALQRLGFGNNPMSRQTIPSWISLLSRLEQLTIQNISIYGEIPDSLGQLSSLLYLVISDSYLGGVLPTSLGNLSLLSALDLQGNQLQGEIPAEITGNLSSLEFLYLSSNFLVGSIPKFSSLRKLKSVQVVSNSLTGTIDNDKIGPGAPLLENFALSDNYFTGNLPDGIGNLSSLQWLGLAINSFRGSIPVLWGNLTNLQYLDLEQNMLEGILPMTLTSCTQLVLLYLLKNKLRGCIPQEIGQLVNLEEVYLSYNFLSGTIPSSFSNFSKMGIMSLDHNRFGGVIPGHTLSRMASSLTQLDISYNFISGFLPTELHLLTNLQHLDVSANNISGSIGPGLATCILLAYLDVSLNNFTGILPSDLGLLQGFQFFNVSYNNFEGPIPTSGLFLTQNITKSSFLGNPGLCGSTRLVSRQCSNLSVSGHHHCHSFKCRSIWIPVVVSISAFLFLGMVMIYVWNLAGREKTGQDSFTDFILQGRIILSEQELMTIIEGGEARVIGMGARSIVYKGVLPGGEIFALKVLRNEDTEKDGNCNMDKTEELLREVQTLAQLRHVNIIKVLGLCVTPHVKALILEYMPRGNLHDLLYNDEEERCSLSHHQRFKIILGIAESLVYLHHSFHEPIIHRDLKPSNILLRMDLEPKLGDFGISKFARLQTQGDLEASASAICGTFGYMPPEYAFQSKVSAKGDVYSFGVIVLELLTGRKPASESSSLANGDLVQFVLGSFKERSFELLDSTLMEEGRLNLTSKDQMMLLLRVGVLCTRATPNSRPSMKDVLGMLKQIIDVGSDIKTLKTMEELANEITIWDPDAAQQPGDQVSSSSS